MILGPLKRIGWGLIVTPDSTWIEEIDTIRSLIMVSHSIFSDTVLFSHCYFAAAVVMDSVIFKKEVSFWVSTFGDYASFSDATFKKSANFSSVHFSQRVDFINTKFENAVYLVSAIFDGGSIFSNATFGGDVYLSPIEFKFIYVSWKQLDDHLVYNPPANYKLKKYFEDQRQLDDADGVYLFLKDQERIQKSKLRRYFEWWFIQQTFGYGVKPWRPLITSALVIILFTFIYLILDTQEKEQLNLGLANQGRQTFKWRLSRGFYYSINTFIIGSPPNWTVGTGHSQKWFRIWTTIERTLGWILLALFVVTLTRKFIR